MIRETATGVELSVRVIPRAARNAVGPVRDHALTIRLTAPPVEGAANDALVAYLAQLLGIAPSHIHIAAGGRSRRKRVSIQGLSGEEVRSRIEGR